MPSVAVAGRADLTDAQWAVLEPLLPVGKKPGRPPQYTRRQLINGIRWRVRAGTPWRDVPPDYGSWQAIYGLFRRWQRAGVWAQILARLQARADAAGLITWDVSVDSTIARAHQHAAGARKKGARRRNHQAESATRSLPITHWAGLGAGGQPSCIWPPSRPKDHSRWSSPQANAATRPSFRWCWERFGSCAWAVADQGPGRIGCWRTRLTVPARIGPMCVVVGSGARFRRRLIRYGIARPKDVLVVGHQRSTRRSTSRGTRWSAESTGSNATAP